MWKQLTPSEKAPYEELSSQDKKRYRREKAADTLMEDVEPVVES